MRCAILFEQKRSSAFAYALVAQLDRVSGYEPEGRGFESLPAYQKAVERFCVLQPVAAQSNSSPFAGRQPAR